MTAPGVTVDWVSLAPYGFSKYEIRSRGGYGLDENQWPVRRAGNGKPLKVSLGSNGYPRVKPYNDQGQQKTVEVHALIMLANVGPPEAGQETRHLDNDPLNYRWAAGGEAETKAAGGNLVYGTKKANHADQVEAGTATRPEYPCAGGCGGTASFAGARCRPCMTAAGKRAADLLNSGVPLPEVTRRCGYKSESWTFAAARDCGGYTKTPAQARHPRRKPLLRRVLDRLRRRGGDTA
jgi:hypothetical protein